MINQNNKNHFTNYTILLQESAEYLKKDDGIANAHQEASNEGQTEVLFFINLIHFYKFM